MWKSLADADIHKEYPVVCSNTYFRGVSNLLIIKSRWHAPQGTCYHLSLFYDRLLRLEYAELFRAIHVIYFYHSFLLAAYQALSDRLTLLLDEGKHFYYRLSRFMLRYQVEELILFREACEHAGVELVNIEVSLLGSQIEFRGLTWHLLAEIARG
jgi:hypothetical protein